MVAQAIIRHRLWRIDLILSCTLGEVLLGGTKHNDAELLVRECVLIPFSVFNARSLQQKIAHFHGQVVIATFVEGILITVVKKAWVVDLVMIAQLGRILWHQKAGKDFVYVKTNKVDTAQQLIRMTHNFRGEMAYYQSWVAGFSPNQPQGVFLPTWFTF